MKTVTTIDPNEIPQGALHNYLLSAVAPRPICFASTIDELGNVNLSPFSFFNVFSSNPPVMVFSPARRGRDNTTKHTYENIVEVKEVVINIVNYPIVEQMSLSSTEYEKGVNEFIKAGLTEVPSEKIRPPRVKESPVSFECEVEQIIELGKEGGAGNLIIARVVMLHIQNQYLDKAGNLDTKKLDLVARMGGSWYCHANGSALFEIPKPLRTKGIGIDQLPENIRNSKVLTGNDLGRLGNLEVLPNPMDIEAIKKDTQIKELLENYAKQPLVLIEQIHQLAKEMLDQGQSDKALTMLLFLENL